MRDLISQAQASARDGRHLGSDALVTQLAQAMQSARGAPTAPPPPFFSGFIMAINFNGILYPDPDVYTSDVDHRGFGFDP